MPIFAEAMASKQQIASTGQNSTTEEKIKGAARKVFTQKGFAATRTRDIAEESGFNLALINYYFRSKEGLFNIIMMEQLQGFVGNILNIVNDTATTLQEKIEQIVSYYIDMLKANPDLPMFILQEVRTNPDKFIENAGAGMNLKDLYLSKQWKQMAKSKGRIMIHPRHILLNALSMTVFPFIASPLLRSKTGMGERQFNRMMDERKKLIPAWIMQMLETDIHTTEHEKK